MFYLQKFQLTIMTKFDSLDAYFNKVSFDVYCPLATIAEQFYSCCSDPFDKTASGPYIDGKKVTYCPNKPLSPSGQMCKNKYGWAIEILGKMFRTEFNKSDYSATRIRVHIQYRHPEIAQFIYDRIIINRPDIDLESPDTIGVDCKTMDEVASLDLVFMQYENQWAMNIETQKNIERYNNRGSLGHSTHSLITSICVMMIFIGLISQCCT